MPTIIHEESVKFFTFYFDGSFYRGMNYQGKLYKQMTTFMSTQRSKAFVCACKLAAQKIQTILTASDKCYTVWTDLCAAQQVQFEPVEMESSLVCGGSDLSY